MMHHTIEFDNDLSCFMVSSTGPATTSDMRSLVGQVLKDERWRKGMNVIIDYRIADLDSLTISDAESLASYIKMLKDKIGGGHVAHVVSRMVDYGMVRMWENLMEEQVPFNFRVFYDMEDARKWIAGSAQ